jgi:NDP-sugar pyrophosphorylase family protein
MRAMVLAAGLGTRLRPLTDDKPKALVEIEGRTLLELTLTRLRSFGVSDVIVNLHHFADMILDYLAAKQSFGMRLAISREDELLDTGGGLKEAAWFFLEDSRDQPFVLHNVDVVSNIDLADGAGASGGAVGLSRVLRHSRTFATTTYGDDGDRGVLHH